MIWKAKMKCDTWNFEAKNWWKVNTFRNGGSHNLLKINNTLPELSFETLSLVELRKSWLTYTLLLKEGMQVRISKFLNNQPTYSSTYGSRRSGQVGYVVPSSPELPIGNIRTPLSTTCKRCLWEAALLDNVFFSFFQLTPFVFFKCIGPFRFCAIS